MGRMIPRLLVRFPTWLTALRAVLFLDHDKLALKGEFI
jgi:hypothetical protein